MKRDDGIRVRELLKETYSRLCKRNNIEEVVLNNMAFAEIANDSDWHRTKIGYMGYKSVGLFKYDGKIWVIGRGEACGAYPAERYDSDILALELQPEILDEIKKSTRKLEKMIEESTYFRNSLIYGMADSSLAVNKNGRFGKTMIELIVPEVEKFIAKDPEYDYECLSVSTLDFVCKRPVKYKQEFIDFLTRCIEDVLKRESSRTS